MGQKLYSRRDWEPVARKRRTGAGLLLIGGGVITAAGAWWAASKASATRDAVEQAVQKGGRFQARATGYWPFTARADERQMEGGLVDRKGQPLHTLEDVQGGRADFVSVSGDPDIFPYGQRLSIDAWPGVVFRVVDTGSHFHGAKKVYRVVGAEPLDICVQSSATPVPKLVTATIIPGDNFAKGAQVATAKMKDQTVAGAVLGRTSLDCEALARAIESELGQRPYAEQVAAAWAIRNRADRAGVSVHALLAPKSTYGAPMVSGGYVSTRRVPTANAQRVAAEVLDARAERDPTDGAIDFWMPGEQDKMRRLGDVYRAASSSGDLDKARRYRRWADYGSEGDVRAQHAQRGLDVVHVVGGIELLGRRS